MKIYHVTATDRADPVNYFEPTMKAAEGLKRTLKAEGHTDIEITPWEVASTRVSIAKSLNRVITMLCANEH